MLKRIYFLLLALIIASAGANAAPVKKVNTIKSPLLNAPVIVLRGGSFDAVFAGGGGVKKASLTGSRDTALRVDLAVEGGDVTAAKLKVPDNAKEALYDLAVDFMDGTSDTQPHAVKVVAKFKKKFDFIHFTDLHFNSGGPEFVESRVKILKSMSAASPEFILSSGDLVSNPVSYDRDYPTGYRELVAHLNAPVYIVPGNHECYVDSALAPPVDGMEYWKAQYDIEYMSFDYGDLHVVGINNFQWEKKFRERYNADHAFFGTQGLARIMPEQWDWLAKDLQEAKPRAKSAVAFMHIPLETFAGGRRIGFEDRKPISGPDKDKFVSLMTANNVSHVFVGHMHWNDEKDFSGLKQIMTLTAGSGGDKEWGYRIVHVEDGRVTGWDVITFNPETGEMK